MAEKKNPCGCGCGLKQDVAKAEKNQEQAKNPKESK
jgi:hypothetical protein